ncbi:FxLYD domain-containing protein [Evansella cellulosilytica]|uniref:DUF4878 domain-containing protein n=1 Tax=Evansella cellulosilytica (strain ATCC 21833 / DSM 2522 / FERM P-1141 / JCM 9156 / N-4) TaxID=649639 RepID=E6TX83_EVAC2|nr:FxLYD domain-containing protein [Evansella cellulosilytica]ADU32278.1 hypothetical protein Bcell_4048 [Evansella cellulosilytica DSM 2522]
MKKTVLLLFSMLLLFFIVACGSEEEANVDAEETEEETEEIEEQEPEEEEISDEELIIEVIQLNLDAGNNEDIDLYMSTLHSDSPQYDLTREQLTQLFEVYDLQYTLDDIEVIEITGDEAEVRLIQTTEKLAGPEFQDNQVEALNRMKKENGEWKIYDTEIIEATYLNDEDTEAAVTDGEAIDFGGGLTLTDHGYAADGFYQYVVGTIVNESDSTYSYVQVDVSLTDENGNIIGGTFDNINNLEPGQTWEFEALVFDDGVAYYEIVDIFGYDLSVFDTDFDPSHLEVVDHKLVSDDYYSYVEGTIVNEGDETYSYVQIDISLYDEDGNRIGSTFDNINDLQPGETWKFEALIFEPNVDSYEIIEISGF